MTPAECKDKDETYCVSYIRIFANSNIKVCEKDWFVSDGGRYGCRKSCKLCTPTTTPNPCEDKDEKNCQSYVKIYAKSNYKICEKDWFVSDGGRYACKKSCGLC